MIQALIGCLVAYIIAQIIVSVKKDNPEKLVPPNGNILVIDTKTNGFSKNLKVSLHDVENCPRITSMAWNKIAPNGELLSNNCAKVKPEKFSISEKNRNIHGISNLSEIVNGVLMKDILLTFDKELLDCKYIVAHNIEFDFRVLTNEYSKVGRILIN